jgi:hypothetical protein
MKFSLPEPIARLGARLRRSPLTWIVAAELCVMLALGYFAWHLIGGQQNRPAPSTGQAEPEPYPSQSPPPFFTPMPAAARSPRPGSGPPGPGADRTRDPVQLPFELDALNRDQARLEAQQWALVKTVTRAVQTYLERVVLPAVLRAEERKHDQ